MKILARCYLILAVLLTVVGGIQCFRWFKFGPWSYVINFLPAAAFLLAFVITYKINRAGIQVLVVPVTVLVLCGWGWFTHAMEWIGRATTDVTDIRKYEHIVNDYWSFNKNLVSHFPQPIPADARNVKFFFRPAFLQGNAHLELRYSASPETIMELRDSFSQSKTQSFMSGEGEVTLFFTANSEIFELSEDYEIILLSKPDDYDSPPGPSYGVAISLKRNEIVYWADSW